MFCLIWYIIIDIQLVAFKYAGQTTNISNFCGHITSQTIIKVILSISLNFVSHKTN